MRRVDYLTEGTDFNALTAAHFMQQDVVYFYKASNGEKLAAAIATGNFGSIPIVDHDLKPIGIVSEHDLLKAMRAGKDLYKVNTEDIMTRPPVTVSTETTAGEIMEVLQNQRLIRLPVVDQDGKLVGVVARRDLLQGYLNTRAPAKAWWM